MQVEYLKQYSKAIDDLGADFQIEKMGEYLHRIRPRDFSSNLQAEGQSEYRAKVALVAITHGDEVIGLHILLELIANLIDGKVQLNGELYLVLANYPAYLQDQRYIDVDLNRVYAASDLTKQEVIRANEIKQVVDECDYIIDIHQCIEETPHPFFILPYSTTNYEWVKRVAPDIPVIARPHLKNVTTLSSYGFLSGKKAVTFEVGAYGVDEQQLEIGMNVVTGFLDYAWMRGSSTVSNLKSAPVYEIKYLQPYSSGEVRFDKQFYHFEDVRKDQGIVYVDGELIRSQIEGKILLYPSKWFKTGSTVKADGLFAILQKFEIRN